VVVIVATMMVGMTVAMRVWSTVIKREKEDELIFRGRQYAMALYLYRKQRGTLPTDLKQLAELGPAQTYVLRQPWKDPITGQDFGIIMAGPNNTPIPDEPVEYGDADSSTQLGLGSNAPRPASSFGNPSDPSQASSFGQTGGKPSAFGGTMGGVPQAGQTTSGGLPIMGVHSKSHDTAQAPAKWNDLDQYNQWFFLVTDLTGQGTAPRVQIPGGGLPGQGMPGTASPGGGGFGGRGATPGGNRPGSGFGGGGGNKPGPDPD
jgi:type II secretory pathway pseudopilin PulG